MSGKMRTTEEEIRGLLGSGRDAGSLDNREVCGPYMEELEPSREIEIKVCT